MSHDFDKTVTELYSFIDYEKLVKPEPYGTTEDDLFKFSQVLKNRGNPQYRYRTIHIAGSKGKGSTAVICESILRAAGYKTGLYTSPHLIDIRERIKLDGKPILRRDFVRKLSELIDYAREIGVPKGYRTVFEIMTATAFEYFTEEKIDIGIIECGLGGRLDATNVLRPAVTVITTVGLDHTAILGNTIEEIALEKAHIIKSSTPVILGPQEPEASAVIRDFAIRCGAPGLIEIGQDAILSSIKIDKCGTTFDLQFGNKHYKNLHLPLIGEFQAFNSAVAIVTVLQMRNIGVEVDEKHIREGLETVRWPGRMHLFEGIPDILIDGAHSPMSVRATLDSIKRIWPEKALITVFAANRDKDIRGMLVPICNSVRTLILTRFDWPRAAVPGELADLIEKKDAEIIEEPDLERAILKAREMGGKEDLLLITGSLYLAGEALKIQGYKID